MGNVKGECVCFCFYGWLGGGICRGDWKINLYVCFFFFLWEREEFILNFLVRYYSGIYVVRGGNGMVD